MITSCEKCGRENELFTTSTNQWNFLTDKYPAYVVSAINNYPPSPTPFLVPSATFYTYNCAVPIHQPLTRSV